MVEELRNLAARVQGFRKVLWPDRKKQVQGQAPRGQARALVDAYFRDVRDKLRLGGISDETLSVLDGEMHELLELAARRSAGVRYISVLDAVLENLRRLEHVALEVSAGSSSDSALAGVDERIVETLATMVPSAARSYEQALIDLAGPDRLSWRGPATDLREALRETLDHLAPDEDVVGGPGFKLEKDTSGPTMKQKVRYVLSKRGLSKSAERGSGGRGSSRRRSRRHVRQVCLRALQRVYTYTYGA